MRRLQRGAAALLITLLLSLALAFGMLALHHVIGIDQQRVEQQLRSVRAFEAAEAGLAWAQAQLNHPGAIDVNCAASVDSAAISFRAQTVTMSTLTGAISVTGWQPRCVEGSGTWSCSCGAKDIASPQPTGAAFSLNFQAVATAGQMRVVAHGCDRPASECASGSLTAANATTATTVDLALVPGLRRAPTAALSVRDPASQSIDQFFAGFFGLDPTTWLAQPAAARVTCSAADCGDAIATAIAAGYDLIAIDGDARIAGPRSLGTGDHPIVLIARGSLYIDGALQVVGVLYGGSVTIGTPGSQVRGALITAGTYSGPSPLGVQLDAGVLAAVRQRTGSFARIADSWRDF